MSRCDLKLNHASAAWLRSQLIFRPLVEPKSLLSLSHSAKLPKFWKNPVFCWHCMTAFDKPLSSKTSLEWVLFIEYYEFYKPCEMFCLKLSIFWEICTHKMGGGGRELYNRLMYIAPSSDHSLLTLNLPFKVILYRDLRLFSASRVKILHFSKENSFKSTNTIIWL